MQSLMLALISLLVFGCSDVEEPALEEVKDTLYFKFTLDGNQYSSEIKESNLIPGSGNEKKEDETSIGMNFMMYAYHSNLIWMFYGDRCGSEPGRDCVAFQFFVPQNLKEGSYSALSNYGITVNGREFKNANDSNISMVITKYDQENSIMEGTVKGQFIKYQDTSGKVFLLDGEFRIYIYY